MFVHALILLLSGAQMGQGQASTGVTPPRVTTPPAEVKNPATLKGKVLNATTGEPLRRALVTLIPADMSAQGAMPITVSTGAEGVFIFEGVEAGKYRLGAERTGYVRSTYGGRGSVQAGTVLTVTEGQELKGLDFKLLPHGVIAGRVLDEEGEPVAGAEIRTVTLRYFQNRRQLLPMGGASTNDLGEYRVFGLPPGRYYVSAILRQHGMFGTPVSAPQVNQGYAPTYYPGVTDPAGAVPLAIQPGRQVANIDLRLARVRTVRVRGRVNGSDSKQARTTVSLVPRESAFAIGDRGMNAVRPDGSFEIGSVTPGSYYVIAQGFENSQRRLGRVPVDVASDNIDNVEITMDAGQEIPGTMRLDGETTVDLSTVRLFFEPK